MKKLSIIPNLCIGCRECELMCSLRHDGLFNPALARIRVEYNADGNCYDPIICRHCDEPACKETCYTGALSRHEKTGAMVLDNDKCTLCYECVDACPYDAINVAPDGSILKCDLCGGTPTCVRFCSKRPEMSSPLMMNPENATAIVFAEE